MKKNNRYFFLTLGIVFTLFNVLAFVIPTEFTASFWAAYAFTVVAFAAQIVIRCVTSGKNETPKSRYLGVPVIYVGTVYLFIQLIIFFLFKFIPRLPIWLVVVLCSIILGAAALCAIAGHAGASEIKRIDDKIKMKRYFISALQVDIEMLAESEADASTRAELKKLAEAIRFSDPMSNEALAELEARITSKVEELKSSSDKTALITEVERLLVERNKKCKILKG